MNRMVVIFCAACAAVALGGQPTSESSGQQTPQSQPSTSELTLTAQQRAMGLARVWSEVRYNYPMAHRLKGLDWDAQFQARLAEVLPEQSDRDYYRRLQALAALVRDSHVSVSPPQRLRRVGPPVRLWPVGGRFVVIAYGEGADPAGQLAIGDMVAAVDGVPVDTYAAQQISPYVCATDSFRLTSTASALLAGEPGTRLTLDLIKPDKSAYTCTLIRDDAAGRWVSYEPLARQTKVTGRRLGDGVGYISIGGFGSKSVVGGFDDQLRALGDIRALVIDLRVNGGGNSGYGDRIISRLIDKPIPNTIERRMSYLPALRSWGRGEKGSGRMWNDIRMEPCQPADGGELRFSGPLAVLTSPSTASAAEDFLAPLKGAGRAIVVGQPTSGSTGNPLMFDLPGGGQLRVCTRYMLMPDGSEFIDVGIAPDIPVAPTAQDIAQGRDVVLEAAVAELGKRLAAPASSTAPADSATISNTSAAKE